MFIQKQLSFFDEEEELGDLERLKFVIDTMPDEEIINKLKKFRKKDEKDYWPIEAMWNSFIASYVFEHPTVAALIRELSRNSQLREICGFAPICVKQSDGSFKKYIVPSEAAYTRFFTNLLKCAEEMDNAFYGLVNYMYENLPDFGEDAAGDGKAIRSYAKKISDKKGNRGEHDANWGVKKYTESTNDKGEKIIKKQSWFGFRLHLIVDAKYELPIAYELTKASNSEKNEMLKLLKNVKKKNPIVIERAKNFFGDKGYDDTKLIEWLESEEISPIIDIQNHWKDGERTKQYENKDIVYTYDGKVYYIDDKGNEIKLLYKGYDKSSRSLRYKLPPQYSDDRIFRIKIDTDRRVFTPVARDSMKWKREYKKRTSVERENGRIDRDYNFELHTIRGLNKMKMFITMAFLVQLSMAKSKIERNKTEHLSALVA